MYVCHVDDICLSQAVAAAAAAAVAARLSTMKLWLRVVYCFVVMHVGIVLTKVASTCSTALLACDCKQAY